MAIDPFIPSNFIARRNTDGFTEMRARLDDLQRQMSTGRKAELNSQLGVDLRVSLDVRAKLNVGEGWLKGIEQGELRIKFMMQSVEGFSKAALDTKADARPGGFVLGANGQVAGQALAAGRLQSVIDMLNVDVDGRYLFSGRSHDQKPVLGFSEIMKPLSAGGAAGIEAMIDERFRADRGLGGMGRLTTAIAGSAVTIARETPAPNVTYGFTLSSASSDAAGITASTAGGPPPTSIGFTVGAQPPVGGKIRFAMTMGDGTERTVELEVRRQGSGGPAETGFELGATTALTAANLEASVRAALTKETQTHLQAYSAVTASRAFFFDGGAQTEPVRVPGPGAPETATAPPAVPATPGTTLIWYRGDADASVSARNTSMLQIDDMQRTPIGARANEQAFREGMAMMAAFAAVDFPATDVNSRDRYEALADRVRRGLAFDGQQKPQDIGVEIAASQSAMKAAKDRHTTSANLLEAARAGVEDASQEEVASQLLSLQTRLQASYQTTSILSRLSLVNYLG